MAKYKRYDYSFSLRISGKNKAAPIGAALQN